MCVLNGDYGYNYRDTTRFDSAILDTEEAYIAKGSLTRTKALGAMIQRGAAVVCVQMNTQEQLVVFLPAVFAFAWFVGDLWAAGLGTVFVVGRDDRITYAAYMPTLGAEPEYEEVLEAARQALG